MSRQLQQLGPYVAQALGMSFEQALQSFRCSTEADIPAVLRLRHAVASSGRWWNDEGFLRWRYFERHVAQTTSSTYWVFERDGEILGGVGLEPVALVAGSHTYPAVRSMDIVVRPDLDGRGLGALMNLLLFERYPIILVMGSNERSHSLIARLFTRVLDLGSWKCLVRSRYVLDQRLKLGPLSRPAAAAVDVAIAAGRRLRRISIPRELDIRELREFDDRVSPLVDSLADDGRNFVRRDADYLNWRFVRNPRCEYRALGAFVGDSMLGYVVVRSNSSRPNPVGQGDIVDWLVAPWGPFGFERVLQFLFQTAIERLAGDGAHLISCLASDDASEAAARRNGIRRRPGERLSFFIHVADTSAQQQIISSGNWFLTGCDFDVE